MNFDMQLTVGDLKDGMEGWASIWAPVQANWGNFRIKADEPLSLSQDEEHPVRVWRDDIGLHGKTLKPRQYEPKDGGAWAGYLEFQSFEKPI